MIEKLLKSTARNGWIVSLRLLGVALLIVGIVTAVLGMMIAGITPLLWILLGLGSFLGVICNSLFRVVMILEQKARE